MLLQSSQFFGGADPHSGSRMTGRFDPASCKEQREIATAPFYNMTKSVSQALSSDRTRPRSPRRSHASGGGEIVRTPGRWASPEKSGGNSVVQ